MLSQLTNNTQLYLAVRPMAGVTIEVTGTLFPSCMLGVAFNSALPMDHISSSKFDVRLQAVHHITLVVN